ncbi:hypothetical protein [Neisseria elongata]|uniref:hypothetical protein n=1 Tax=Neisseria elongata TaxID=495 RepID=UPI000665BAA9|nr:hypothetical protein [Neisseria elongata]
MGMFIANAFTGLKEAGTLLKGFSQLKTDAEVAQKTIELNQIIAAVQNDLFEAQTAYSAAVGRINELEKELMAIKDWSTEQQRYQLYELAPGSFVYRLKVEMAHGEPIHDICPQCYEQSIKSILQFNGYEGAFHKYSCSCCQTMILGERLRSDVEVISTGGTRFRRWTEGY